MKKTPKEIRETAAELKASVPEFGNSRLCHVIRSSADILNELANSLEWYRFDDVQPPKGADIWQGRFIAGGLWSRTDRPYQIQQHGFDYWSYGITPPPPPKPDKFEEIWNQHDEYVAGDATKVINGSRMSKHQFMAAAAAVKAAYGIKEED